MKISLKTLYHPLIDSLLCMGAAAAALVAGRPAFALGSCEQLVKLATPKFDITAAETIRSGVFTASKEKAFGDLPPFCRVAATLHPSIDSAIRIELWMPEAKWNERMEGTGNGGFAGSVAYGALADALKRGYAVVNTDMGMATPAGQDATDFVGRPERWKDWGYRSTHEMTVQAKRLITAFYGSSARHSYFVGCSTGGEQAWMEAQRYPEDYDGIVGGAPANNRTGVHQSILWNFISTETTPEDRLPPTKLRILAKAVLNACDHLDGVVDGIVSDPERCFFDPATLACSGAENENCLTGRQVAVVRRLYAGPSNPRTSQQIYPGMPKGSELGWDHLGPDARGDPPFAPIFKWVFGRAWDWHQFDFDRSADAFEQRLASDLNATGTNLNRFRDLGHKLIVYHGWSDWLVVPGESLNFRYALLSGPSGKTLDSFYRLFMMPGMNHCGGGVGPDRFDALGAVVEWVETGHAPDRLIASQMQNSEHSDKRLRTRTLCPYPQVARYEGHGSVDEAANFSCVLK